MATLTFAQTISYVPPLGSSVVTSSNTVSVSYAGQAAGSIDVAKDTAKDTAFDLDFGSIAKASFVSIKNNLAEAITIQSGSTSEVDASVGAGGIMTFAMATPPETIGITDAIQVKLSDKATIAGSIDYVIVGDPPA